MARIPTVTITVNGRRKIVNADDPRARQDAAPGITREDIAAMPGPDLSDLLALHGVESAPRALADRRALLTRILFVET